MSIPPALARIHDPALLVQDPLACLAEARARHGDQVVLRDGAALLSGAPECPGAVALFGPDWQRAVLAHPETFHAAPSTARAVGLPDDVVGLTQSLHVMHGREHATHKRVVAAALDAAASQERDDGVAAIIAWFADAWLSSGEIVLFDGMQRLSAQIAAEILFGAGDARSVGLIEALMRFFASRRELSRRGPVAVVSDAGRRLDGLLRETLAGGHDRGGVAYRLRCELPETATIAHLNVLFMSLVEPVAVAATWMLLILTQRPRLRRTLREAHRRADPGPPAAEMKHAMSETLRLLSPNALMVRVAAQEFACAGTVLPPGCEIVLAPFLCHRDPGLFSDPAVFRPARWAAPRVASPFAYMPFGAGIHACVGRALAESLVGRIVGGILSRLDPILLQAQVIDWHIDITFRPRSAFRVAAASAAQGRCRTSPVWQGPIADMVQFEPELY